jgi:trk system potassium uptake protein TrkH
MVVFAAGSVIMSYLGVDFMTAVGSVATSIGNIGPGIGSVGPVNNFAHIPYMGKWFLSFLMLLGRLELFTVIILFTPYFWRKY